MSFVNPILRKAGEQIAQAIHPDGSVYSSKVTPLETTDRYEMYEMEYPGGAEVPSHFHHNGKETFFILNGDIESVVAGNKFSMKPGDLVHTQSYIPHYFKFSKGTKLLSIFFDMHYHYKETNRSLNDKYLLADDYKLDANYETDRQTNDDFYVMEFAKPIENQNHYYLRRKGEQLLSYKNEVGTHNLKVPLWETSGNGEIWEVVWNNDVEIEMHKHIFLYESFYVVNGSIEINDGQQVYVAEAGDSVHLRPFIPHSLKVLSDDTRTLNVMVNINGRGHSTLQSLTEVELLQERNPELLSDKELMDSLLVKKDFYRMSIKTSEEK